MRQASAFLCTIGHHNNSRSALVFHHILPSNKKKKTHQLNLSGDAGGALEKKL